MRSYGAAAAAGPAAITTAPVQGRATEATSPPKGPAATLTGRKSGVGQHQASGTRSSSTQCARRELSTGANPYSSRHRESPRKEIFPGEQAGAGGKPPAMDVDRRSLN